MKRKIIHIDEEKCNGCGACASACHEGAIDMVDGKAKLMRENFCDGFGDCLPGCPTGAITFEEREAPDYDEAAVALDKIRKSIHSNNIQKFSPSKDWESSSRVVPENSMTERCPGSRTRSFVTAEDRSNLSDSSFDKMPSQLLQWPVQIKLLPAKAPFFDHSRLLIAADCTAYAYADFHHSFMRGKVTLIGCPKLDSINYTEKLTEIIKNNDVQSVTVIRMEVPCCGGLENAAKNAIRQSGKFIPWQIITVSCDGHLID